MTVVYTGPHEAVVTADGLTFPHGVAVKVPKALGESLTARPDFKTSEGK